MEVKKGIVTVMSAKAGMSGEEVLGDTSLPQRICQAEKY